MVLNELLRCSPNLAHRLTMWVGIPKNLHQTYRPHLQSLQGEVSIRLFEAEPEPHDPYFVKLGLANLLPQLCSTDQFLYLDYDHVVLGPLCLDDYRQPGIMVSSEVKQLDHSISSWRDDAVLSALDIGKPHFNNSLIFTSVATMQAIVGAWHEWYHSLQCLPPQMREEIAFCLAVEAEGEGLIPAPHHVQEYFREDLQESVLFHYGGPHERGRALKQFLQERAAELCWEDLTSDALSREHRMLHAQLQSLSPDTHKLHA